MENIEMKVNGNILTITVDISQRHGLSSSGKTHRIASTLGNKPVPGAPAVIAGINIYTKA